MQHCFVWSAGQLWSAPVGVAEGVAEETEVAKPNALSKAAEGITSAPARAVRAAARTVVVSFILLVLLSIDSI